MNESDRWEQMLTLLISPTKVDHGELSIGRNTDRASRRNLASIPSSSSTCCPTPIVAVERQTGSEVLVSWHDPTRCRYDEQRWTSAKARGRGTCALSGRLIRIGDEIYKPLWRGAKPPANASAMIIATELERFIDRLPSP
ncbi:DUF3331 domain-containing protein [Burkholderia lata]|nr:DUF3331 domain-containing protein [Burkholderia lata]